MYTSIYSHHLACQLRKTCGRFHLQFLASVAWNSIVHGDNFPLFGDPVIEANFIFAILLRFFRPMPCHETGAVNAPNLRMRSQKNKTMINKTRKNRLTSKNIDLFISFHFGRFFFWGKCFCFGFQGHPFPIVVVGAPNPKKNVGSLPETNISPLKIGRNPKGKDHLPTTHFQGLLLLVFREV